MKIVLIALVVLGVAYLERSRQAETHKQQMNDAVDIAILKACNFGVRNTCLKYADCSVNSIEQIQEKICVLE